MGFKIQYPWFRVQDLELRVIGLRVKGLGFKV
jgi:hypothetical protein